jgi:hypothetical protein
MATIVNDGFVKDDGYGFVNNNYNMLPIQIGDHFRSVSFRFVFYPFDTFSRHFSFIRKPYARAHSDLKRAMKRHAGPTPRYWARATTYDLRLPLRM